MANLQEVINMLEKGRNSVLQLDTFMQGGNGLLVEEIMASLSRAINHLETQKAPCAKVKKVKGHSAKKTTNRRRIDIDSCTKIVGETSEDSYIWRKYGEKTINGLKYPRCYYRCTHKDDQNCQATKQVQKSTQNPSKYEIFYFRNHTCTNNLYNCNQQQESENSSFEINFGNSNSEMSTQSTHVYSTISSSLMQDTANSPDPMWLQSYVADCVSSPSVDSSSGSFAPGKDFDQFGDSCFVDQFDQFLPTI